LTNRGLKYGEFAVKPNMQADESTKQMLIQDHNKAVENQKKASKELHDTKLYTSTRTSKFLNTISESMLAHEMKQAENFVSVRAQADELRWDLLRCDTKISHSPQPQFQRVRSVQVDDEGIMYCSCDFFSQNGIPCRHMCHVSKNYRPNFEWNEMDVDVRHFSGYTFFLTARSHSEMDNHGRATKALYRKRRTELFLGPFCKREELYCWKMTACGSCPVNIFSHMHSSTLRYDAVQPVLNEWMAEIENASPELFHQGLELIRQSIFTMRKERVRSAPVGAVVSCAVPAANPSIRLKKQRLFADKANKK
jgi:SWIM zinc finger